jgi:hypothetical protein
MNEQNNTPRKIKNFLLNPDIQLAFALNIVALSAFFVIGIAFVVYFQLGDFIQNILSLSDFDLKTLTQLRNDWDGTMLWLGLFMVSYVGITVAICIIYTHRMIGPTIAFKRQISDLIDGKYSSKVNLREGDAFEDVADLLNDLAKSLDDKHSESSEQHSKDSSHAKDSTHESAS